MNRPNDPELAAAAEEELKHALTLTWAALAKLVPWGDSYEGFGPDGGALTFERSYIWRGAAGGDILCEVTAYRGPASFEAGARASRVIAKP
jgi:hypothetical protein